MFPFLGDQRRFLVVLTLSRELLDLGMGLVGRVDGNAYAIYHGGWAGSRAHVHAESPGV